MKKGIILAACFVLLHVYSWGQSSTLPPEINYSGSVVDLESLEPIEKCKIRVFKGKVLFLETYSAADGSFEIQLRAEIKYRFETQMQYYRKLTREVNLGRPRMKIPRIKVYLEKEGLKCKGHVYDSVGKPMRNMKIILFNNTLKLKKTLYTDYKGYYTYKLNKDQLYTLKVDTTIDGLQLDRFSFSTLGLNPDQDIIKDFFFTFQSNSREFLELSKNLAKNNEASFTLIDSAKPVMPKSKKPPISNTTTKQKTHNVAIKEVKKDNTALTDVKKKEEKLSEEKSSSLAKNDSLKAIKNKDSLIAAKPLTEKKETGTATKKGTNKTEKEIEKQQENFFVQVKKNDSIPASKSIAVKPEVTVQKTSENASDSGHVKQTISVSDYKKKLSEGSLEKSETVKTDYKRLPELDEGSELIFVKENTIFYPPGKALLNKKGYAMLDKLVEEFKQTKNRKMLIEIFSDAAGEYSIKDYICRLRSEEIVKYLIRKGMTFDQMLVSIFGYKVLANECKRGVECSDEKHQENRRSRITIVENYKLEVGSK